MKGKGRQTHLQSLQQQYDSLPSEQSENPDNASISTSKRKRPRLDQDYSDPEPSSSSDIPDSIFLHRDDVLGPMRALGGNELQQFT